MKAWRIFSIFCFDRMNNQFWFLLCIFDDVNKQSNVLAKLLIIVDLFNNFVNSTEIMLAAMKLLDKFYQQMLFDKGFAN